MANYKKSSQNREQVEIAKGFLQGIGSATGGTVTESIQAGSVVEVEFSASAGPVTVGVDRQRTGALPLSNSTGQALTDWSVDNATNDLSVTLNGSGTGSVFFWVF